MASKNKKNKERNCKSHHGFALKDKGGRMKRMLYYNSAQRAKIKHMTYLEHIDYDGEAMRLEEQWHRDEYQKYRLNGGEMTFQEWVEWLYWVPDDFELK
jgi:hypothetical protein